MIYILVIIALLLAAYICHLKAQFYLDSSFRFFLVDVYRIALYVLCVAAMIIAFAWFYNSS